MKVLSPMLAFVIPLGGCSSCEKDKPYVPYAIDPSSTTPSGMTSTPTGPALSAAVSDKTFTPVVAKRIKGNQTKIDTGNGTIKAAEQSVFELLLESDFTADGKVDVAAWLRTSDGMAGELVQYVASRKGGALRARTLIPLPADMTLREGCKAKTDLRQVGPRTLAMSFVRDCKGGLHEVTEWKAAVVPVRDPAVRLTFLVDQPSDGQRLKIEFDGLDRDGDQFDDLRSSIRLSPGRKTLDEASQRPVEVNLHYFDRPAGLSRDPHQPASSFKAIAQRLHREAAGSKRDRVVPAARAAQRIHQMLCAEEGRPQVRIGGAPLQCGATDAMQRISRAELDALLGLKDRISALGAYDRLQAQGANAKSLDSARKRVEKDIPRRDVDSYHLPFGPPTSQASWGPLAFHFDGALMIRTDASVMRFNPKTRVAIPDPESGPISPWSMKIQDPSGAVSLDSIVDPCDGGLLFARLNHQGNTEPVYLPVVATTTRRCSNAGREVAARPILWSKEGLMLIVSGTPLWLKSDGKKVRRRIPGDRVGALGGPKSPDGKWLAHASALGVLVLKSDGSALLWKTPSMVSGYERLTACTVASGAAAVACIDGSRTRVFLPSI